MSATCRKTVTPKPPSKVLFVRYLSELDGTPALGQDHLHESRVLLL